MSGAAHFAIVLIGAVAFFALIAIITATAYLWRIAQALEELQAEVHNRRVVGEFASEIKSKVSRN